MTISSPAVAHQPSGDRPSAFLTSTARHVHVHRFVSALSDGEQNRSGHQHLRLRDIPARAARAPTSPPFPGSPAYRRGRLRARAVATRNPVRHSRTRRPPDRPVALHDATRYPPGDAPASGSSDAAHPRLPFLAKVEPKPSRRSCAGPVPATNRPSTPCVHTKTYALRTRRQNPTRSTPQRHRVLPARRTRAACQRRRQTRQSSSQTLPHGTWTTRQPDGASDPSEQHRRRPPGLIPSGVIACGPDHDPEASSPSTTPHAVVRAFTR